VTFRWHMCWPFCNKSSVDIKSTLFFDSHVNNMGIALPTHVCTYQAMWNTADLPIQLPLSENNSAQVWKLIGEIGKDESQKVCLAKLLQPRCVLRSLECDNTCNWQISHWSKHKCRVSQQFLHGLQKSSGLSTQKLTRRPNIGYWRYFKYWFQAR